MLYFLPLLIWRRLSFFKDISCLTSFYAVEQHYMLLTTVNYRFVLRACNLARIFKNIGRATSGVPWKLVLENSSSGAGDDTFWLRSNIKKWFISKQSSLWYLKLFCQIQIECDLDNWSCNEQNALITRSLGHILFSEIFRTFLVFTHYAIKQ